MMLFAIFQVAMNQHQQEEIERARRLRKAQEQHQQLTAAAIAHERAIHDALAESKGVTSWH